MTAGTVTYALGNGKRFPGNSSVNVVRLSLVFITIELTLLLAGRTHPYNFTHTHTQRMTSHFPGLTFVLPYLLRLWYIRVTNVSTNSIKFLSFGWVWSEYFFNQLNYCCSDFVYFQIPSILIRLCVTIIKFICYFFIFHKFRVKYVMKELRVSASEILSNHVTSYFWNRAFIYKLVFTSKYLAHFVQKIDINNTILIVGYLRAILIICLMQFNNWENVCLFLVDVCTCSFTCICNYY